MKLVGTVLAPLCLVTVATLLGPASASAAPGGGTHIVSSGVLPVFDARLGRSRLLSPAALPAALAGYWTPARRAAALPAPESASVPTSLLPQRAAAAAPRTIAEPTAPARSTTPASPGRLPAVAGAEGRAFFHNPVNGRDYVCSAGTINSGNRRLVLTAAHCVHGGTGQQWMQNWLFYPGYQSGPGPAGAFPAYQLWAQSEWTDNSDRHFDYAFAVMQDGPAGSRIVDAVGGNGLIINPGRPFVTAIGYPRSFARGERQASCRAQLVQRSIVDPDQQLNCFMGAGASGEPWLQNYDPANRLGWAVSDESYGAHGDHRPPEVGPYFDSGTSAVYSAAENASP